MGQRVVFVTVSDLSGTSGHNVATKEMASAFGRYENVDLTVVCPSASNPVPDGFSDSVDEFVHFSACGSSPFGRVKTQLSLFRTLQQYLSKQSPDLVVTRHAPTMIAPAVVSKIHKLTHFLLVRGQAYDRLQFPRLLKTILYINVRLSVSIYCAYPEIEEDIKSLGYDAPVTVFNNAVDPDMFQPQPKAEARNTIGLDADTDQTVVGFVGSMKDRHHIEELLRATARADESGSITLVLVGDGPERDKFERQAVELGLENVRFTGFVPHSDVATYISACDVLYGVADPEQPSDPLKCYEYLACGRPVIVSEFGFEFVEKIDAGLTVDATAPDLIADAIDAFATMGEEKRMKMGERGSEYVLENHTWDRLPEIVLSDFESHRFCSK